MNVFFATPCDIAEITEKYIVLELDSFRLPSVPDVTTSWCVLDLTSIPIDDLNSVDRMRNLHNNMMRNYKLRNWNYCRNALEHLFGKWNGQVDSFYQVFDKRIATYLDQDPGKDWDTVIVRGDCDDIAVGDDLR